jgi:hypothetical protein
VFGVRLQLEIDRDGGRTHTSDDAGARLA